MHPIAQCSSVDASLSLEGGRVRAQVLLRTLASVLVYASELTRNHNVNHNHNLVCLYDVVYGQLRLCLCTELHCMYVCIYALYFYIVFCNPLSWAAFVSLK